MHSTPATPNTNFPGSPASSRPAFFERRFARPLLAGIAALILGGSADSQALPPTYSFTALYQTGGDVPGAGANPKIQAGAKWTGFGSPALATFGSTAVVGKWKAPAVTGANPLPAQSGVGIFVNDLVNTNLIVKVGDPVPGYPGLTFKAFKDPAIGDAPYIALIATVTGPGVLSTNDTVVVTNGRDGNLEVLAREGDTNLFTAETSVIKGFGAVAINHPVFPPPNGSFSGIAFSATLVVGSGLGLPVTTANDSGIWMLNPGATQVQRVVRESESDYYDGVGAFFPVKSFSAFKGLAGSPAQNRAMLTGDEILVQGTLVDGRQAAWFASGGFAGSPLATSGTAFGTALPQATWARVGLPSGHGGFRAGYLSVLGSLKAGAGGVTSANATGIFAAANPSNSGYTWTPIARQGDSAPGIAGATFGSFKNPAGYVAFPATVKGAGVTAADNDGLWMAIPGVSALQLIAREGAQPPGAPAGAKWKNFTSVIETGGVDMAMLFTANLQKGVGATPGPGGITSLDDVALYAAAYDFDTNTYHTTELVRENQPLLGKTVKSFSVLKAAAGSTGTGRSYSANPRDTTVLLVTFTDNTRAIVKVAANPPAI
jgi:hypothetical protein